MSFLNMRRVSTRMHMLVALAVLGLLILCVTALIQLRSSMLDDRKEKIRNVVEIGLGVLKYYHQQAESGKMTQDEAKLAAKMALRVSRFGPAEDYLYIYLGSGINFMHPVRPDFEGKDKREMKDSRGKLLIQEILATAREPGGGFVEFWFPRPGQEKEVPKLGYAQIFAPWDMVIGTGIYIDDIDRQFQQNATVLGAMSLFLLVLFSLAGWQISRSILTQLGGEPVIATALMLRVAQGDLAAAQVNAPVGSLLHSLNEMVTSLRGLVGEIERGADDLVSNARAISMAFEEVDRAAVQQVDATSAMASAIEQLTVSSSHISDSARETARDSADAANLASLGATQVEQAALAIQKISGTVSDASSRILALESRASQISIIANVIKDIAGQTNLLALNAAIEAARAGEQGRGFAVVADEVRKLAERTSAATMEIDQMIGGIQNETSGAVEAMSAALPEVKEGVGLAGEASASLLSIEESARRTLTRIGDVANATREQSSTSTAIAQRVEQVASMVENTSLTIQQTMGTARQLESIADDLRRQIGRFSI